MDVRHPSERAGDEKGEEGKVHEEWEEVDARKNNEMKKRRTNRRRRIKRKKTKGK